MQYKVTNNSNITACELYMHQRQSEKTIWQFFSIYIVGRDFVERGFVSGVFCHWPIYRNNALNRDIYVILRKQLVDSQTM